MLRASFVRIASKTVQGTTKGSRLTSVVSPSNRVAQPLQTVAPWHSREFSSSLRSQYEDEVFVKTYSSDHDEADCLETGKEALRRKDKKKKEELSTFRFSATVHKDEEGREVHHETFTDKFDEADSIEAGKGVLLSPEADAIEVGKDQKKKGM